MLNRARRTSASVARSASRTTTSFDRAKTRPYSAIVSETNATSQCGRSSASGDAPVTARSTAFATSRRKSIGGGSDARTCAEEDEDGDAAKAAPGSGLARGRSSSQSFCVHVAFTT